MLGLIGGGNMEDRCVMCGRYVPEGTQVCNNCIADVENKVNKPRKPKSLIERILDKLFRRK